VEGETVLWEDHLLDTKSSSVVGDLLDSNAFRSFKKISGVQRPRVSLFCAIVRQRTNEYKFERILERLWSDHSDAAARVSFWRCFSDSACQMFFYWYFHRNKVWPTPHEFPWGKPLKHMLGAMMFGLPCLVDVLRNVCLNNDAEGPAISIRLVESHLDGTFNIFRVVDFI
jgi:hypothetical protein